MTRRLVGPAMLALSLAACSARQSAEAPVAPWLLAEPDRCLLHRDLREGMDQMARRCAERFIEENGYTDVPATRDTSRLVAETREPGSWGEILDRRHGLLERQAATMVCTQLECRVFFRLRIQRGHCDYRAVLMTQVFTRMHLQYGIVHDTRCGLITS